MPGSSTALGAAPQRWQVSGAGSSPTSCLCSPDILLGSPCQLCDEKWLCSRVCFPLNPSRKELVFSSSVLLKLALASCRIPASARASSPGKSCRDKLGVRAKWPKEHVQEQHSEQRCCSTPGKLCCWGEKSPKKSDFGAARRGSSTAQLQGAAVGTGSRGMGLGHSQNFLMTLFFGGEKKEKKMVCLIL